MLPFARWTARICLVASLVLPFLPVVKPQQAHASSGATIRQEINIIDTTLTGANVAVSSNELVQVDTTQYSGTASYYFEVVAQVTSGGTGSIRLRRAGTTTDDSTIAVSSLGTVATEVRSTAFTPPSGQTQYFIFGDAAGTSKTLTIKEARIIIIQNSDPLSSTESQFEIGDNETGLVSTTATPLNNPKYWKYTAADWDGAKTFYAEVTTGRSGSSTTTVVLQQDNGSFASWTNVATVVSSSATAVTRYRVNFTPTDGRNYRLAASEGSAAGSRTYSIYNGKIIVDQDSSNVEDSYSETNQDNYDVLNAGGRIANAQSFTAASSNSISGAVFYLRSVGTPTGNAVAKLYTHSGTYGTSSVPTGAALATSDPFSVASLTTSFQLITFTFSGANQVALTAGTHYEIGIYYNGGDSLDQIRVGHDASSSTASGNRAYTTDESTWTTSPSDMVFYVYGGSSTILHLEGQYLLLNTADAGTGRNGYRSLWDQTEWSGVSNTYYHTMDSNNASNSCNIQDADAQDTLVANTQITGANQVVSSAFTMPPSGDHIINNVVATPGVIAADRVLVVVNIVPVSVSITSDGAVAYGVLAVGAVQDTTAAGVNDTQEVTNNGSNAEDVNIAGQNSANWTLAASPGSDTYEEDFCTSGSGSPDPCDASPTWTALSASYQLLSSNLAASAPQRFDLRLDAPSTSSSTAQQSVDVTIQVVAH